MGHFGPILRILWQIRIFIKNPFLPVFSNFGQVLLCKISEKTNERILRYSGLTDTHTDRRTDGQAWIYRTLPACRGSKNKDHALSWNLQKVSTWKVYKYIWIFNLKVPSPLDKEDDRWCYFPNVSKNAFQSIQYTCKAGMGEILNEKDTFCEKKAKTVVKN